MKNILKKIVNISVASFLLFCIYSAISICVKNNQKEFDLDYYVREYKSFCGTIDFKYESNGRRSSSCFVVIDNHECRVSRRFYNSHKVGDYSCITDHYTEPNGYALIGVMVITCIMVGVLILLCRWLYKFVL